MGVGAYLDSYTVITVPCALQMAPRNTGRLQEAGFQKGFQGTLCCAQESVAASWPYGQCGKPGGRVRGAQWPHVSAQDRLWSCSHLGWEECFLN